MSSEPRPPASVPLSEPEIGGNAWAYVKECLDTGWVSSVGSFVERFEREVASYVGAGHAVAVVNGTAALHAALLAVGVRPGDEVLVPALSFVAPAATIRYCGAQPVFVDADPATWQIDPAKIERFLEEECDTTSAGCVDRGTGRPVRAVLAVHVLGLACDIDRIAVAALRHGLRVVEDAAEAMGVRHRGRHAGTAGDAGAFSFNGNKIVTTGGGGMVVTGDPEIADRLRYLTTQAKDDPLEYVHNEIGYNYRLTNLQAALGVAQLEHLDEFVERKRAIAYAYEKALRDLGGVTPMPTPRGCDPTYWLYTVLLEDATLERRKEVVGRLRERGIEARPIWHTLHDLPPFRDCAAYRIEHATLIYERGISLPSSVGLTPDDQERCIAALKESLGS